MNHSPSLFSWMRPLAGCAVLFLWGLGTVFAQGRREAVVGAPSDLVWYDDLETAVQAQRAGQDVLAVDLTRQRLQSLPSDLMLLTDLTYLIVNRNRLSEFPSWFAELGSLKVLMADHNRLEEFPKVLLGMPKVEQLSLGENYLGGIPMDIDGMASLEILSLWGNVLARFPASLGNLEHLQILDLLHNEMTIDEQEMLKALLPDVQLNLSEPCNCEFDVGFSSYPSREMP